MSPRRYLVTGASRGIGRALCERLVRDGHQVTGIARGRDPSFPGDLITLDLGDIQATRKALTQLMDDARFDGLVNNVGLVKGARAVDVDLADLDMVMRVNVHSAVLATQAVVPHMTAQGWGRIVNVSSVAILGAVERTAYAAAKSALASFTRTWALELASAGVTVNTVAPGPTETELFRANNAPGSEGERRFRSMAPMGRLAQPDEVAAAIAFLLGDDAGFITGQTLFVDGGASIGKAPV